MQLILEGLSKKYPKNKLFEDLTFTFKSGNAYAITGENGSGKSTLIQIIAGVIAPSKGQVYYEQDKQKVEKENLHKLLGIVAPYLDLITEFTLKEHLDFHSTFKKSVPEYDLMQEIEKANLYKSLNKPLAEFSSGMQQRVKLILCCLFDNQVLLLDEPTSHLDTKGIEWYQQLLEKTKKNRIILIASNEPEEYRKFVEQILSIDEY